MSPSERGALLAIDAGPYHTIASSRVQGARRRVALALVVAGYARILPRRGRWARRFAVTAAGAHALGTFATSRDLGDEMRDMRNACNREVA